MEAVEAAVSGTTAADEFDPPDVDAFQKSVACCRSPLTVQTRLSMLNVHHVERQKLVFDCSHVVL
jgi:hypothetical protein